MAFISEQVQKYARGKVSVKKRRFMEGGFDLDLTCTTRAEPEHIPSLSTSKAHLPSGRLL